MVIFRFLSTLVSSFRKTFSFLASRKGFSLVEVIISLLTIALLGLLIQSTLIIAQSFRVSQSNEFETRGLVNMVQKIVCLSNTSFKISNLNFSKTYYMNDQDVDGIFSRTYTKVGNVLPSDTIPIMSLNVEGAYSEERSFFTGNQGLDELLADKTEESEHNRYISYADEKAVFYKVFQDSHTLGKININSDDLEGNFQSGYIFASRCVPNEDASLYKAGGFVGTFDPRALKKSALYILQEMEYRPFYFPGDGITAEELVRCCRDGSVPGDCKSISEYVPRIYIIGIGPATGSSGNSVASFVADVKFIQESPEMQDMQLIWGSGFLVSIAKFRAIHSNTKFYLNTMFLKNTCLTSHENINECPQLSFGVHPDGQLVKGESMARYYLEADTTGSCSGYSSRIDSTDMILF